MVPVSDLTRGLVRKADLTDPILARGKAGAQGGVPLQVPPPLHPVPAAGRQKIIRPKSESPQEFHPVGAAPNRGSFDRPVIGPQQDSNLGHFVQGYGGLVLRPLGHARRWVLGLGNWSRSVSTTDPKIFDAKVISQIRTRPC